MGLQVGDSVKFLNEKGGGTISGIDAKGIIYVTDQNGFDIPVTGNEIVLDPSSAPRSKDTASNNGKDKHDKAPKNKPVKDIGEADATQDVSLALGLYPEQQSRLTNSAIQVYLINDSGYYVHYAMYNETGGENKYFADGVVKPGTKIMLRKHDQSVLTQWNKVKVQAFFTGKGSYELIPPIDYSYNMDKLRLYKEFTYTENDYFDGKAVILPLMPNKQVYEKQFEDTDALVKMIEEKERQQEENNFRSPKPASGIIEVDLHIHELADDYSQLTNTEMVNIQMDHFREALLKALSSNATKIVFIHGVGNGTLKHEIRKELERKYPKLIFQDASFKEYGFGATLVYLR